MTARILIAESSATSRITLKVRLSGACYDVMSAATVEDVVSQLRSGRPDLILLGPSFVGLPMTEFFRLVAIERPRTPVLALADGQRRVRGAGGGGIGGPGPAGRGTDAAGAGARLAARFRNRRW